MARSFLPVSAAIVILLVAGFAIYAWQPALPSDTSPLASRFDPVLVEKGAALAALGGCSSCHSLPDRPAFSGGVGVKTPFGTVYASNITPDPETGIGDWSEAAFRRSMREGLDRAGRHLYPAFPYEHFTLVTDEDDRALYAFLMSRAPVKNVPPANNLMFPLDIRGVVAAWKLLFFREGAWQRDPLRDPAWNRGVYLVEGLGHCGACHTPRNLFGAEKAEANLASGVVDGWTAYAINAASPAPIPWDVDGLASYLGHGWAADHGVARGPMAAVTLSLASASPADLSAMGTYLVSSMGVPPPDKIRRAQAHRNQDTLEPPLAATGSQITVMPVETRSGAALYAGACASCHDSGRPLPFGAIALELSTAIHAPDPTDLIQVTLKGLMPESADPGPVMPGFANLSDEEIARLLAYLRETVAMEQPWPKLAQAVRDVRASNRRTGPVPVGPTIHDNP